MSARLGRIAILHYSTIGQKRTNAKEKPGSTQWLFIIFEAEGSLIQGNLKVV